MHAVLIKIYQITSKIKNEDSSSDTSIELFGGKANNLHGYIAHVEVYFLFHFVFFFE